MPPLAQGTRNKGPGLPCVEQAVGHDPGGQVGAGESPPGLEGVLGHAQAVVRKVTLQAQALDLDSRHIQGLRVAQGTTHGGGQGQT